MIFSEVEKMFLGKIHGLAWIQTAARTFESIWQDIYGLLLAYSGILSSATAKRLFKK